MLYVVNNLLIEADSEEEATDTAVEMLKVGEFVAVGLTRSGMLVYEWVPRQKQGSRNDD